MDKSKIWNTLKTVGFSLVFCLIMCVVSFAADGDAASSSFDLTSTVTSAVTDIAGQLLTVVGVVVAGIVGFFGAKIAINKAFSFIKTMIGKA